MNNPIHCTVSQCWVLIADRIRSTHSTVCCFFFIFCPFSDICKYILNFFIKDSIKTHALDDLKKICFIGSVTFGRGSLDNRHYSRWHCLKKSVLDKCHVVQNVALWRICEGGQVQAVPRVLMEMFFMCSVLPPVFVFTYRPWTRRSTEAARALTQMPPMFSLQVLRRNTRRLMRNLTTWWKAIKS